MVIVKVVSAVQMRKLLSLDQSSHTTGYAVLEGDKLLIVGKFTFDDDDLGVRLEKIRKQIISLIKEFNINEVVFEDIQLQDVGGSKEVGIKTFKILAEVFGVVYELLTEMGIKHSCVAPIVWKSTFKIAGKGRKQEKKMAQEYVNTKYNLCCTEDEADAVCIGLHLIKKEEAEFNWD